MTGSTAVTTTYKETSSVVRCCQSAARHTSTPHFTVARFAFDAPALPLVGDTLPLAESMRFALMGHYQRLLHFNTYGTAERPFQERFYSPTFAGKDAERQPLQGHRHAFYLPADEDDDGRLDHITVVAEQGFTAEEVRVLDRLRDVRLGEGDPLRLLLVGLGRADNLRAPVLASSKTWVSATPFVATRYPKLRGQKRDRPEDLATPQAFVRRVLHQELERLRQRRPDLPAVVDILPAGGISSRLLRPIQFQRFRRKYDDDGGRRPSGAFRITFAEPVPGPICLGHSCHFGLGLFVPGNEKEAAMP
ncbi:MAG: type I-U CRISPR-associated protein Cas5/Cas6 [Planctomycetes bacterium]|nr:type I-U CRISPR-associated protein Cas5/Cas6 [Planctomycetota bacterium]